MGVNGGMIPSVALTSFIATAEGKHLDEATQLHAAYKDTLGTGEPWTIGYGHTTQSGIAIHGVLNGEIYHGEEVVKGLLIDEEEALRLLEVTIARKADIVRTAIQVPLTQSQFDALVDMAYNLGSKPFRKGSDIVAALNGGVDDRNIPIGPGYYDRVADEFLRWGKAQGKPLKALHSRRIAAALMYKGLPFQWALYNPKIDLQTSLAVAMDTAKDIDDEPFVEMDPPSSYSKIIEVIEPHIEKAREVEAVEQTKPPSVYTKRLEDVPYKIDPDAGLKPLEESSRAHGYVWQSVGTVLLRVGAASGVAGAGTVAADPALSNALMALFVVGGVGLTGFVIKSYGDWKRAKGETEASQGLY